MVSVRLMVEVLDHYHGPEGHKLWLLAWAENANDQSRQGWPGRALLAHRTGKSPSRVSHIAAELAGEGVLKRVGGGGRHRGEARYELLPLAPAGGSQGAGAANPDQGAPRAHPERPVRVRNRGSQGAESGSQGAAISALPAETSHNPQNPQEPSSPRVREPAITAVRTVFPSATDDEIETLIQERLARGARNVAAVVRYEAQQDTLRLPCDRAGPASHSNACRDGSDSGCVMDWCKCRCHTEPASGEAQR